MARIIGYARVSTDAQNPDGQVDALRAAGAAHVYVDKISGRSATDSRPELSRALADAQAGDTLLVWRCDRMARSLSDLIGRIKALTDDGVQFRSLTEPHIDTTTPEGTLMLNLVGAFAQFEADLVSSRTRAGLAAARAKGHAVGRPRVVTPEAAALAQKYRAQGMATSEVAKKMRVSARTVSRLLALPLDDEPAPVDTHASTPARESTANGWPTN